VHSRFDEFRATPLGQQLESLIDNDVRYPEYAALSRVGFPAVAALIHDLQTYFPEVANDQTARQFCGAAVAEVMRRHYHDILRPRGRIPGGYLTYGAVWTPIPQRRDFSELLGHLRATPDDVVAAASAVPSQQWHLRPEGTGFSVTEHLCHLRDLDEVYIERIRRMLSETLPALESVNGVQLATERNYAGQEAVVAIEAYRQTRRTLVQLLERTSPDDQGRIGLFDGIRRLTLAELVEDVHRHDRTHIQELNELHDELLNLPEKS
jgi:uncharacterized damage-inducible protein DinB